MVNFGEFLKIWSFRSNSVTRQINFKRTKNGEKCQNWKTQMRHIGWFLNTLWEIEQNGILGKRGLPAGPIFLFIWTFRLITNYLGVLQSLLMIRNKKASKVAKLIAQLRFTAQFLSITPACCFCPLFIGVLCSWLSLTSAFFVTLQNTLNRVLNSTEI